MTPTRSRTSSTRFSAVRRPVGSPRGRAARPRRGRDVEHGVDLTLEEAFSGATRRLTIKQDGRARTVDVRIPAGVKDGARVRAAGEGEPAPPGGSAGDLFLVVRILPHARFERRGQDLYTKVRIPVATAVLGGEIPVETLTGSSLRLTCTGADRLGPAVPAARSRDAAGRKAGRARRHVRRRGNRDPDRALRGGTANITRRCGNWNARRPPRTDHDHEPQSLHRKGAGSHPRSPAGGRTERPSGGAARAPRSWPWSSSATASCRRCSAR